DQQHDLVALDLSLGDDVLLAFVGPCGSGDLGAFLRQRQERRTRFFLRFYDFESTRPFAGDIRVGGRDQGQRAEQQDAENRFHGGPLWGGSTAGAAKSSQGFRRLDGTRPVRLSAARPRCGSSGPTSTSTRPPFSVWLPPDWAAPAILLRVLAHEI